MLYSGSLGEYRANFFGEGFEKHVYVLEVLSSGDVGSRRIWAFLSAYNVTRNAASFSMRNFRVTAAENNGLDRIAVLSCGFYGYG